MAEVAAATHHAITHHAPDLLILAGIAGAYPGSGLAVGDVALVASERVADLGAMRGGRFTPLYNQVYPCPFATPDFGLPLVASNTVNTAAGGIDVSEGVMENMEGAAFFAVCLAADVKFLELRAVSNVVGADRADWDISLAVKRLSSALNRLSDEIDA